MADRVWKVNYCYVEVPNRAGQGASILGQLSEAGVNLLAYSGFPCARARRQVARARAAGRFGLPNSDGRRRGCAHEP
jgi:hypothetical protein